MYDLPYYKEKDPQVIKEFIDQHPFAFISGCDADNKPVATQIPVFIEEHDGRKILRGHIMKGMDHHIALFAQSKRACGFYRSSHLCKRNVV